MAQLTQTELTALTDDELLAEAKKSKSARTLNAALFGSVSYTHLIFYAYIFFYKEFSRLPF